MGPAELFSERAVDPAEDLGIPEGTFAIQIWTVAQNDAYCPAYRASLFVAIQLIVQIAQPAIRAILASEIKA